jgi:O-antigen biosynthesis alpha-1,2-rahmnosyltransferase
MSRPLLSVICPSYNRPEHLAPLLDSILAQGFKDWECVITEDCAPSRPQIQSICEEYATRSGGRIRLHLNEENLGFDAGIRRLVHLARGQFVFLMGDDDLVAPGAFSAVARAVERYPNMGVLLRATAYFRGTPDNVVQVNRFYAEECTFPAGPKALVACYRRLVAMSGIVMHRDLCEEYATDRWDGSLFYQHWLAANVLIERDAVYIPDLMAYFRKGGTPMFGTAKAEAGLYTPGSQPPDTDIKMIRNLLAIAADVEQRRGVPVAALIEHDFANYIYPTIAHQAHEPWPVFYQFYKDLGKLGLRRYLSFHCWFWAVALLGAGNVDRVLQAVRRMFGHTPNLTRYVRPRRQPAPG